MAFGDNWDSSGWDWKHIDAAKLSALLQQLPEGSTVCCNDIRNLAIFDASGMQLGYIEIGRENVVLFQDECEDQL